jgi:hypothetical protein
MRKRIVRFGLLAIAALGWNAVAGACVSPSESEKIAYSDAVVEGVATCVPERGRCRLMATKVVKEDRRRPGSGIYILRFEAGARARLRREIEGGFAFNICSVPWEPSIGRFEGRFYLSRVLGGYRPRPGSPDGREKSSRS